MDSSDTKRACTAPEAVRKREDGTMEITVEDIVGGGQRQHI